MWINIRMIVLRVDYLDLREAILLSLIGGFIFFRLRNGSISAAASLTLHVTADLLINLSKKTYTARQDCHSFKVPWASL